MWVSCNQRFYFLIISLGVLAVVFGLPSCYPELPDDPVCFLDGNQLQNQSFSDQSVQSNRCCDSTQADSTQKCVDFFTIELSSKAISKVRSNAIRFKRSIYLKRRLLVTFVESGRSLTLHFNNGRAPTIMSRVIEIKLNSRLLS